MELTVFRPWDKFGPALTPADLRGTGSLIIDEHSLPEADASVLQRSDGIVDIQIQYFEEYLRFLELMCWCEDAVIGVLPIPVRLPPEEISEEIFKASGHFGRHSGQADLQKKTIERLETDGVIKRRALKADDDMLGPDTYVRRLLAASPSYRDHFKPGLDLSRWTQEDEERLIWYTRHHGSSCVLTEFARRAKLLSHIPIVSHNVDIGSLDILEETIQSNVVGRLMERLSVGAKKELESLEALGASLNLPPSPVAAHILRESNTKDDLVSVALQLRSSLKGVRQHVNGLQHDMLDENLAVDTRLRRAKEIQRVMSKLSPEQPIDMKKKIQSYSSFVDNIKDSVLDGGEFTIRRATDIIISRPVEMVIDRFRFRKYRVLFDMKNKFLTDSSYHKKVCSVLGYRADDPSVNVSLHYCGHAKLNSYRQPGFGAKR